MDWLDSIANEFEQLGRDIEAGWNRAGEELQQLGQEITQSRDNAINYAEGLPAEIQDSVLNIENALLNDNWNPDNSWIKNNNDPFIDGLNPDPPIDPPVNPPIDPPVNPPIDPPVNPPVDPNPPIDPINPPVNPNIPGNSRHLVPSSSVDGNNDSHLEDLIGTNGGTRAGMRLGSRRILSQASQVSVGYGISEAKNQIMNKYPQSDINTRAGNFLFGGILQEATELDNPVGNYDGIDQLITSALVFGISYYLLTTTSNIVTQSYGLLNNSPLGSISNTLRYGGGRVIGAGQLEGSRWFIQAGNVANTGNNLITTLRNAGIRQTTINNLRVTTSSLGYFFRLPYTMRWFLTSVLERVYHTIPAVSGTVQALLNSPERMLVIVQSMTNIADISIKAIISTICSGIAFNLYDALKALNTFEKYSYPGKNHVIPQALHIGANIANNFMDESALKILSVIPTIFGIKDQGIALKLVNVFWSFGKDLREGEVGIDVAIDNLFSKYIPQALDGKHILDLIPPDIISKINSGLNTEITEAMLANVLKNLANSGQLVPIIDAFLVNMGGTSESIQGMDIFWQIFKTAPLLSVLKDAVIGFKTDVGPLDLMSNENLNILGFQFYHKEETEEEANEANSTNFESKLMNFELHGKYCGPGNPMDNGEPIDAFDRACQKHDLGYEQKGMFNRETDTEFVSDLRKILDTETLSNSVRLKVKGAILHFDRVIINRHK